MRFDFNKTIILALVLFSFCYSQGSNSIFEDPLIALINGYNPSGEDFNIFEDSSCMKIVYAKFDFNQDGIDDIALSEMSYIWGNAGGPWQIYLGLDNGYYKYIDDLFMQPWCLNTIQNEKGEKYLVTFWKSSFNEGDLLYYQFKHGKIDKTKKLKIHLEDIESKRIFDEYFQSKKFNNLCKYYNITAIDSILNKSKSKP